MRAAGRLGLAVHPARRRRRPSSIGVLTVAALNPIAAAAMSAQFEQRPRRVDGARRRPTRRKDDLAAPGRRPHPDRHPRAGRDDGGGARAPAATSRCSSTPSDGRRRAAVLAPDRGRRGAADAGLLAADRRARGRRRAARRCAPTPCRSPPPWTSRTALERFASPQAIAVLAAAARPSRRTEQAGFSATAYRLRLQQLLATPLLFAAMSILAAAFSLRLMRLGGLAGLAGRRRGAGLRRSSSSTSSAARWARPTSFRRSLAAWTPPVLALLSGLHPALLHRRRLGVGVSRPSIAVQSGMSAAWVASRERIAGGRSRLAGACAPAASAGRWPAGRAAWSRARPLAPDRRAARRPTAAADRARPTTAWATSGVYLEADDARVRRQDQGRSPPRRAVEVRYQRPHPARRRADLRHRHRRGHRQRRRHRSSTPTAPPSSPTSWCSTTRCKAGVAQGFAARLQNNVKLAAARARSAAARRQRAEPGDLHALRRSARRTERQGRRPGRSRPTRWSRTAQRQTDLLPQRRDPRARRPGALPAGVLAPRPRRPSASRACWCPAPRSPSKRGLSYEQPYYCGDLALVRPDLSPQINTKVNPFLNVRMPQAVLFRRP